VRIPGHTRWILGSYLHDIFQSWHSSFIVMTQLENHILQPCPTLTNMNSLPMGVIALFKSSFTFFTFLGKNFVGCATSSPDGSSLRGYSRKHVSSIGSIKFSLFHPSHSSSFNNIIGCAASAPDGSSPRGYSRIFLGIDSKMSFLH
jgi:hypothetical protein